MKPANTLVILSDEHQARALSMRRASLVQTPNLDRLAARGTRFTECGHAVPDLRAGARGFRHRPAGAPLPLLGQFVRLRRTRAGAGGMRCRKPGFPSSRSASCIIRRRTCRPVSMPSTCRCISTRASARSGDRSAIRCRHRPSDQAHARRPYRARAIRLHALRPVDRRSRGRMDRGQGPQLGRPWCLYVGFVAPHFPLVAPPEFFSISIRSTSCRRQSCIRATAMCFIPGTRSTRTSGTTRRCSRTRPSGAPRWPRTTASCRGSTTTSGD